MDPSHRPIASHGNGGIWDATQWRGAWAMAVLKPFFRNSYMYLMHE